MRKQYLTIFFAALCYLSIDAQEVYVDCNTGDDRNPGTLESPVFSINKAMEIVNSAENDIYTMKINPGIYILNSHVRIATEKTIANKRLIIEASFLPDDTEWTTEKMPVIISKSKKGDLPENSNIIIDFLVDESHVTIRGLKFLGYCYPVNMFFPIRRSDREKSDLVVEQCMFLADQQTSVIQSAIIAHGDSVKIDHCVFYNVNNTVIFYKCAPGKDFKTGNSMTNCIVYGASECAIWTSFPDKDFVYKNNIITNCNFFWIKYSPNTTVYSIENCIIANNKNYKGDENFKPKNFEMNESNIIKEGEISLRMINTIWEPSPKDHLHVIPGTLGYDIGAGLFKKKDEITVVRNINPCDLGEDVMVYPIPTKNKIYIMYKNPLKNTDYKILDLTGKTVQEGELQNNEIDISGLNKVTYLLSLNIENKILNKMVILE